MAVAVSSPDGSRVRGGDTLWASSHCAPGMREDATDVSVLRLSTCWGEMAVLKLAIDTILEGGIVELLALCAAAGL